MEGSLNLGTQWQALPRLSATLDILEGDGLKLTPVHPYSVSSKLFFNPCSLTSGEVPKAWKVRGGHAGKAEEILEVKPFHPAAWGCVERTVLGLLNPSTATGRDACRGLFVRGWVAFPCVYVYTHPSRSAGAASLLLGA